MTRQHDPLIHLLRELTTRSDQWVETRGRREGVHRTHLHALAHLMDAEEQGRAMSPGDLSAAVGLSAPATTALLDRLVSAGHVERSTHPIDRRRTVLTVTDAARATGFAIFGPLAMRMAPIMDRLDAHEREIITRFLSEIVAVMDPDTED